jgi:hypothetical protein
MHSSGHNLKLVRVMLEDVEEYLLSNELFWPLDPSALRDFPAPPRLTPGTFVLTLDELKVQSEEMNAKQQAEFQKMKFQMQRILQKWPEAIGRKAAREMQSRLNLWKAYVNDLLEKTDRPDNYAYEVRHRVIFERNRQLADRQPETHEIVEAIRSIDAALQSIFTQHEFIWDTRLCAAYPQESYWFLYGVPRINDTDSASFI